MSKNIFYRSVFMLLLITAVAFVLDVQPIYAPTAYAHVLIKHTYRGDLIVDIGFGDPMEPKWSRRIWNGGGGALDDLDLTVDLSSALAFLPPSPTDLSKRLYLKVYDRYNGDQGQIVAFTLMYLGVKYASSDVPMPIKDKQISYVFVPSFPFAHVFIECTSRRDLNAYIGYWSMDFMWQIWRAGSGPSLPNVDLIVDLSNEVQNLPPNPMRPWFIVAGGIVGGTAQGQISQFTITHKGKTYYSMETPIKLPGLAHIPSTFVFEGSLSTKGLATHQFVTISDELDVAGIDVTLQMPTGVDFDLSLLHSPEATVGWKVAGGWWPGSGTLYPPDHTQKGYPSTYSGWYANPEWIRVTFTREYTVWWTVACYAYSGSGNYKITVRLRYRSGT